VCLTPSTAQNTLENGGFCNPVSPQGFNAAGYVLYVEAPWDSENRRYSIDGNQSIMFVDPPFRIGAGDFTLRATITPRVNGRIGRLNANGEIQPATLFSQSMEGSPGTVTGLSVSFVDSNMNGNISNLVGVLLVRDAPVVSPNTFTNDNGQFIRVDITGTWQSNSPVSFRIVRQGARLLMYVNNTLQNGVSSNNSQPLDISSADGQPFYVSPRLDPDVSFEMRSDVDGYLSDMSLQTSAELPEVFSVTSLSTNMF